MEIFPLYLKKPAQVLVARGAQDNAPGMTLEPSVLRRRLANRCAARGNAKTADVIDGPMRVGEGVLVTALYDDTLVQMCDGMTAGGAEQAFIFHRLLREIRISALPPLLCALRIEE